MKKILPQYGVCALAVALMVPLVQAQPAGMQAAFGKDAGTLSDKFTGLARVMSGKYDWKPGQGVRSVGDVFNLIVRENGTLVGVLSGTPNTGTRPAPIADPEKLQEALKASYIDLQKAITGLSDNDLQAPVKLFGRDMTKQGAPMLIIEDQHEHLGQSIAATAWFRPGLSRSADRGHHCPHLNSYTNGAARTRARRAARSSG